MTASIHKYRNSSTNVCNKELRWIAKNNTCNIGCKANSLKCYFDIYNKSKYLYVCYLINDYSKLVPNRIFSLTKITTGGMKMLVRMTFIKIMINQHLLIISQSVFKIATGKLGVMFILSKPQFHLPYCINPGMG